jgi:hypothetical protein
MIPIPLYRRPEHALKSTHSRAFTRGQGRHVSRVGHLGVRAGSSVCTGHAGSVGRTGDGDESAGSAVLKKDVSAFGYSGYAAVGLRSDVRK